MVVLDEQIKSEIVPSIRGIASTFDSAAIVDGYSDLVVDLVKRVAQKIIPFLNFDSEVRQIAGNINEVNSREWSKVSKEALGLDLFKIEPWAKDATESFVTENTALIKSIPDQYLKEVESILIREIRNGTRVESIAKTLSERFQVTRSRGLLIARDQVGKFNGALAKKRQESAGVKRYIWRTVQDERVRPSHRANDGKEFSWDKPPSTGNPGQDYQCRCYADPIFDEVDE